MRLCIIAKKQFKNQIEKLISGFNLLDYEKKVKECRVNVRIQVISRFIPDEETDKEMTYALVQVSRFLRPTRTKWDAYVQLK